MFEAPTVPNYINNTHYLFQLSSRKSSASSTCSFEKTLFQNSPTSAEKSKVEEASKMTRKNLLRNDERSVQSVKDKIALFNTSKSEKSCSGLAHHQSSEDVAYHAGYRKANMTGTNAGYLTRAYTHGDVRFDGSSQQRINSSSRKISSTSNCSSVVATTVSPADKSVSSADLTIREESGSNGKTQTIGKPCNSKRGAPQIPHGRSQSLLEIGSVTTGVQQSALLNQQIKITHTGMGIHHQRRRNTVAKIKDITIPESHEISLGHPRSKNAAEWIVAGSPSSEHRASSKVVRSGRRGSAGSGFATQPDQVLPGGKMFSFRQGLRPSPGSPTDEAQSGGTTATRINKNPRTMRDITARRERNVSSSRCMTDITPRKQNTKFQHGEKRTSLSDFKAIEARELGGKYTNNPQPITSLGRPASRSSSFTIAERKKSFESMAKSSNCNNNNKSLVDKKINYNRSTQLSRHSSQDSLAMRKPCTRRDALLDKATCSSVSSVASNASLLGSCDTIGEETVVGMEPLLAFNSRRSSRSEADGGSRVATPTKTLPTSDGSSTFCRSAPTTPLDRHDYTVCNTNLQMTTSSIQQSEIPLENYCSANALMANCVRSTSIVSKDSGFTDLSPDKDQQQQDDLGMKSLPLTEIQRPKHLDIGAATAVTSLNETISPKAIQKLNEKFENCSSTAETSPAITPTAAMPLAPTTDNSVADSSSSTKVMEVVMTSAASLRKEKLVTHSNVEEYSSASFQLGQETNMRNFNWLEESLADKPFFYLPEESTEWERIEPNEADCFKANVNSSPTSFAREHHRKFSVPVYPTATGMTGNHIADASSGGESSGVKMRSKKDANAAPSRPSSLIETSSQAKAFEIGNLGDRDHRTHTVHSSSTNSCGSSQADILSEIAYSANQNGDTCANSQLKFPQYPPIGFVSSSPSMSTSAKSAGEGSTAANSIPIGKDGPDRRSVSVHDIRRAFEKAEQSLSQTMAASFDCGSDGILPCGQVIKVCKTGSSSSSSGGLGSAPSHNRMSSLDSTTSDESSIPTPHYYGSVSSLLSGQSNNLKDHYGSISSLASSTSLISPQVKKILLLINNVTARRGF